MRTQRIRNLYTHCNPDALQYVYTLHHAAVLATFYIPPENALQATVDDGSLDPKTFHESKLSQQWPH
jgi:hypothetical protein